MKIVTTVRAELRKFSNLVWLALLGTLPYADDIMLALSEHLPALSPYLPENVYKFMGASVVAANILRSVYLSHKKP